MTPEGADLGLPSGDGDPEWEVLIVGAGVCGLYQLYRMCELGVRVLAVDSNPGLGGTWYRNRYPGCRFDSESYSYGYSFSAEVLKEWRWTELFAPQPETLSYLNFVAEKFDLTRHIQFDSRVTSAVFDESTRAWRVELGDGSTLTTRFLLTAVGFLSVPTLPRFEGMDVFAGPSFHTFDWPDEGISLAGKRVAVVGTGSSGVQVISSIAAEVEELVVLQRRPNWCAPLNNQAIDEAAMDEIRNSYDEIFERCMNSPSGFIHAPDSRRTLDVPEADRLAFWERLYGAPGFGLWFGNFRDTLMDPVANGVLSEFVASKIRQRVRDPEVAEKLVPKDHGFGTRRVPMETGYFEVYNQSNVTLVDLTETPVARITSKGIETTNGHYDVDVIVYATGFDAITGPLERMDIVGCDGLQLREKWVDGPRTAFGLSIHGFPNLLTLVAPQGASVSTNFPRGIEDSVNWATNFLEYAWAQGMTRFEATAEAEVSWGEHVADMAEKMLLTKELSWFTGYNTNVREPITKPRHLIYAGGADRYRQRLADERDGGFDSFVFD